MSTDGQTDGRTDGQTDGRKDKPITIVPFDLRQGTNISKGHNSVENKDGL